MTTKSILTLAIGLLFTGYTYAQYTEDDKKEGKIKLKTFCENEPSFDVKSSPDKWKNESAVILAQKYEYSYLQKYKNIEFEMTYRKRIKLQDKAAVEEFSQFYWQAPYKQTGQVTLFGGDATNKFYMEIKIIKSNGNVVDVNTSDAVEVKGAELRNVPRIFRGLGSTGYKKLAIPNLEPGDILDYSYFKRIFEPDSYSQDFGANTITLSEKYPILSQKIILLLEKDFLISLNTYNGAPKFTSKQTQLKYSGLKANDKVTIYTLEDKDREKFSDEPWSYEFVNSPTMKFRIIYPNGVTAKGGSLRGKEPGVVKDKFTSEEIIDNYQYDFKQTLGYASPESAIKYVKTKLGKTAADPKKIADELYYAIRFYNVKNSKSYDGGYNPYSGVYGMSVYAVSMPLKKYYEGLPKELDHLKGMNNTMQNAVEKKEFGVMDHSINFEYSRAVFCKALDKFKVPYKIVLVPERQYGRIEDLMFNHEYEPVVMVESGGKSYFYYGIGYDRTPDLTDYNLEGAEGIAYSPATWKKDRKVERVKITVPTENFSRLNIKTQIDFNPAEYENTQLKREVRVTGDFKYDYSYLNWINDSSDFEDMRRYEKDFNKKFKVKYITGYKVKEAESKKLLSEFYPLRYKVVKTYTEENLKDDYDIEKIDTLILMQNGRYSEKNDIVFKENFKVKDLAAKLGNNFTFSIGKIIGDQLTFEEKYRKDRKTNVDIIFPRTIEYEFVIEIPSGYKIEGLKDLNVSIDNDVASFTTSAVAMDNTILVKTKKVYKHNFEKKENWSKLVDVTQAAYNFSQKKIVLKKG